MSTSTVARYSFAANKSKSSARKSSFRSLFGAAAVASVVLGCGWTVYANIFAASPFPQLGSANFDAPVIRRPQAVAAAATTPATDSNVTRIAEIKPPPMIAAPATVPAGPSLSFADRFAAASPQGVEPAPQPETPKLAEVTRPLPQAPKLAEITRPQSSAPKLAEAPKPAEASKLAETAKPKETQSPAPVQVAAIVPAPPRPAEPRPVKTPGVSLHDMAQRAKAAVMSLASNERQTIVEKLWGSPRSQPRSSSLLAFASADASATGSLGPSQNPALAGNTPRYDQSTAVYDISAHMVYLPDGTRLEAHSGLGSRLDDPSSANIRMRGVTPPHMYELTPREALFHGVPALRLNPVGGEETIYGRSGLLAHTYMLGPNGDSNGCVSFRDYNAFLNAYRNQGIKRLAVVSRID
jgi:Protein of unknown function (DUF2778)